MANPLIKFVESVCVQTAVYWPRPIPDGYGGYSFGSAYPEEISVRWDNVQKYIFSSNGAQIVSIAEILVTQDIEEGGYLYLGTLSDLDSGQEDNPKEVDGAYEIRKVEKTPLFKSTNEFVRTAYL